MNAEKWGAKIKWGNANLLLHNFYVLPAVSSQLSVFSKLCMMNTLLHFLLLLLQLCCSLRNISLGDRILVKLKVIITVGWVWWRHQRASLFSLASGPPTLNPPLPVAVEQPYLGNIMPNSVGVCHTQLWNINLWVRVTNFTGEHKVIFNAVEHWWKVTCNLCEAQTSDATILWTASSPSQTHEDI